MKRFYIILLTLILFGCIDKPTPDSSNEIWTPQFIGDTNLTLRTEFKEGKDILDSSALEIIALGYSNDSTIISVCTWGKAKNKYNAGAEIKNDSLNLYYWISDSLSCDTTKVQIDLTYYLKCPRLRDNIKYQLVYIETNPPKRKKCSW